MHVYPGDIYWEKFVIVNYITKNELNVFNTVYTSSE